MDMGEIVAIGLGGNAFMERGGEWSIEAQWRNIRRAIRGIVDIYLKGYRVLLTHGNGPQVGAILEWIERAGGDGVTLDIANAMTQGWLGYMIQNSIYNELVSRGREARVIAIVNQVSVDPMDPAFRRPEKFIGPTYNRDEASKLSRKYGWIFREDVDGYRRVVPSPEPRRNIEVDVIRMLLDDDYIVIASGGGGIPVAIEDGLVRGVEAVIDKDLSTQVLANRLGAKTMIILTDVDGVYVNYGRPGMRLIREISLQELRKLYEEGEFPPGSMGPKILASIRFLENGGSRVGIGHLADSIGVFEGYRGTQIYLD